MLLWRTYKVILTWTVTRPLRSEEADRTRRRTTVASTVSPESNLQLRGMTVIERYLKIGFDTSFSTLGWSSFLISSCCCCFIRDSEWRPNSYPSLCIVKPLRPVWCGVCILKSLNLGSSKKERKNERRYRPPWGTGVSLSFCSIFRLTNIDNFQLKENIAHTHNICSAERQLADLLIK